MISTNDIERLLESIKRLPYKPDHYEWLENLLEEIEKSEMIAVQIAILKSPKILEVIE